MKNEESDCWSIWYDSEKSGSGVAALGQDYPPKPPLLGLLCSQGSASHWGGTSSPRSQAGFLGQTPITTCYTCLHTHIPWRTRNPFYCLSGLSPPLEWSCGPPHSTHAHLLAINGTAPQTGVPSTASGIYSFGKLHPKHSAHVCASGLLEAVARPQAFDG